MLNTVNGIPTHVLLVHAVVVLVPLAALLGVLSVAWPTARRHLGVITPITALVAVGFVPVASHAGEWLQAHVQDTALMRKHAEMGEGLLPWAGLLFLLTAGLWLLDHAPKRGVKLPSIVTSNWVRPVASALVVVTAVLAVGQTYRIGDSGAKAAWHGQVSTAAVNTGG